VKHACRPLDHRDGILESAYGQQAFARIG
jgi:hypothetical protein